MYLFESVWYILSTSMYTLCSCFQRLICMNSVLPPCSIYFHTSFVHARMPSPCYILQFMSIISITVTSSAYTNISSWSFGVMSLIHLSKNDMNRRVENTAPCLSTASMRNQSISIWPFHTLLTHLLYIFLITLINIGGIL